MIIAGIDIGLKGAVSIFNTETKKLIVFDMPLVEELKGKKIIHKISAGLLVSELKNYNIDLCFVERVGAMPSQGVVSMFNFGRSAGLIDGVLAGLNISTTLISPQVWMKAMSVKGKENSRARAIELLPEYAELFSRKKDDGRSDATLLALFGAYYFNT